MVHSGDKLLDNSPADGNFPRIYFCRCQFYFNSATVYAAFLQRDESIRMGGDDRCYAISGRYPAGYDRGYWGICRAIGIVQQQEAPICDQDNGRVRLKGSLKPPVLLSGAIPSMHKARLVFSHRGLNSLKNILFARNDFSLYERIINSTTYFLR